VEIENLYDLYFKDVYIYIYGITKNKSVAEDITQDTFLKALKNIGKFDGSKDIRAWLFTIAKNTYYTHYNRQKIFTSVEDTFNYQENISTNIVDDMIANDENIMIHQFIHLLNEPYKEVFLLRFYADFSFKKIATICGKGESWARVTYYRAKKQILQKMEGTFYE